MNLYNGLDNDIFDRSDFVQSAEQFSVCILIREGLRIVRSKEFFLIDDELE
jgi:hypothetical protein